MSKKNIAYIILVLLAIVINSWRIFPTVGYYNTNQSAPKGFYLIQNPKPLEKGQYVIIPVPEVVTAIIEGRAWFQPGTPLLKKVGALPGDTVSINTNGIFINDAYIGPVLSEDRQGLPLPQIRGTYTLKDGEFLPISTYERSFDGRYFGPIPIENITYQVAPLLTY